MTEPKSTMARLNKARLDILTKQVDELTETREVTKKAIKQATEILADAKKTMNDLVLIIRKIADAETPEIAQAIARKFFDDMQHGVH